MQKSSDLQWLDEAGTAVEPVPVIGYLAIFGIADVLLGIVLGLLISVIGLQNNSGFNVGILIASCLTAALFFTRKHKRVFLPREYWKMVVGSTLIDFALQLAITFAIIGPPLNVFFFGLLLFMAAMHALVMLFFYSRHMVKHMLPKTPAA